VVESDFCHLFPFWTIWLKSIGIGHDGVTAAVFPVFRLGWFLCGQRCFARVFEWFLAGEYGVKEPRKVFANVLETLWKCVGKGLEGSGSVSAGGFLRLQAVARRGFDGVEVGGKGLFWLAGGWFAGCSSRAPSAPARICFFFTPVTCDL